MQTYTMQYSYTMSKQMIELCVLLVSTKLYNSAFYSVQPNYRIQRGTYYVQ